MRNVDHLALALRRYDRAAKAHQQCPTAATLAELDAATLALRGLALAVQASRRCLAGVSLETP